MYRFLIVSFLLLFASCQTNKKNLAKNQAKTEKSEKTQGKVKFTPLDKLTMQGDRYYTSFVLVENIHNNKDSAKLQELRYFEENNVICSLEEKVVSYNMNFYKMTNCTKRFLKQENDYGGFHRTVMSEKCEDDALGLFYYTRSKVDKNTWISNLDKKNWGETYNDTIICNGK